MYRKASRRTGATYNYGFGWSYGLSYNGPVEPKAISTLLQKRNSLFVRCKNSLCLHKDHFDLRRAIEDKPERADYPIGVFEKNLVCPKCGSKGGKLEL